MRAWLEACANGAHDARGVVSVTKHGRTTRFAVVGVGVAGTGPALGVGPLLAHAADDYFLRALDRAAVYEAIGEHAVSHETYRRKLVEIAGLMAQNGEPLTTTKAVARFARAVSGFRASPAKLGERIRQVSARLDGATLGLLLEPLRTELHRALDALNGASTGGEVESR